MKKALAIVTVAMVAGIASADIAVNLSNSGGLFTTDGSTYVDQVTVQLVWNAGAPVVAPGAVFEGSLMAAGDQILSMFTSTSGYAGTWSDLGDKGGVYGDADVGGAGILSGYLTVRIFDASALTAGSKYLQFDVDIDGGLIEFDNLVASTTYQTEDTLGGNIGAGSYTVIPEPATFGLMGVAGIGMFLARKKARR